MKSKNVLSIAVCVVITLAFVLPVLANVPAPPVNQTIGVPDTEFAHLTEADCRLCHEDPNIVGPTSIPDRHHLLWGSTIPTGQCATFNGTCSTTTTQNCQEDFDCPATETCVTGTRACVNDSNCGASRDLCNVTGDVCPDTCTGDGVTACTTDADCTVAGGTCYRPGQGCPGRSGQVCGQPVCQGGSAAQDADSDQNGVMDTTYGCLTCHVEDTTGGIITMLVYRDCLLCHYQALDTPTVHHATAEAQSGDCVSCHGTLVDNPTGCKELMCAPTSGDDRGDPNAYDPALSCSADADCLTGTCTGGDPCNRDADCPVTETCTGGTGFSARCAYYGGGTCSVTTSAECVNNSDCPTGETCVNSCDDGHVIPTYDPSLVTPARGEHDHVCGVIGGDNGTCSVTTTTACAVDADCPPSETCQFVSCQYDTDCVAGTCSVNTTVTCHVAGDCPDAGETCVGGQECVQDFEIGVAGGCTYCHDAGANTIGIAMDVINNHDTHHHTGVYKNLLGGSDSAKCAWCHMAGYPHTPYGERPEHIRWCENCHGYESLHNIAIDSDTGCLFGDPGCEVIIGGETAGYSHVGNNDDCWGCHGFSTASAPGAGPATPYLFGSDTMGVTSGYNTMVTLIGATLTNLVGSYQWTSDVTMTAADGSSVTLTPESTTSNQLAVTIPAATAPGNYALRAVKGTYAASNPIVISVKPDVVITDSSCNRKKGVLTVSGSGFGEKPAGTDEYINVQVNGQSVNVTSWSDTQITASVSRCSNNSAITVNAVMGSATSGNSGGKPAKPCKGKKCD